MIIIIGEVDKRKAVIESIKLERSAEGRETAEWEIMFLNVCIYV